MAASVLLRCGASEQRPCAERPKKIGVASAMADKRRFPPPWSIKERNQASFPVKDNAGQRSPTSILRRSRAGARRPRC